MVENTSMSGNPPRTLVDTGEFGVIAMLKSHFDRDHPQVVLGIDDDCALVEGPAGLLYALTCDSQVENVHFLPDIIPPRSLGRRVLGVNLSDLAAMGAVPRYALLSLILRKDLELSWLDDVIGGLQKEADTFGAVVVGGNIARSDANLVFDLTLLGEVPRSPLFLRGNARVGDRIMVTGTLGDAAAGLVICRGRGKSGQHPALVERYFCPLPRITVGLALREFGIPLAVIDISDGLIQDLGHILKRSGVGAVIEVDTIPLSPSLSAWSRESNQDPYQFALWGGEDFELLLTVPEHLADEVRQRVEDQTGVPVTSIGRILPGDRLTLRKNGRDYRTDQAGWNHFQAETKNS
ncbi:MAG TPA: thiamine-phosphate kinase [Atribacteraceae bacterium]|nr:thiamine-phosphate kinase [Atribacteraceae bacterium]